MFYKKNNIITLLLLELCKNRMSNKEGHIDVQTIVILGILFVFYVIGDTATTIWLISNHPKDIAAESNPLGIYLYTQQGFYGIMTAKLLGFMAISLMAILIEYHYKHETKVMLVSNYSILALMALSLIVLTVNVMMIYGMNRLYRQIIPKKTQNTT